jgi:hypothetical protein
MVFGGLSCDGPAPVARRTAPGLLARGAVIAEKHGVGVDTVLAAASRLGFMGLEQDASLSAPMLEAFASGVLDVPIFQQVMGQMRGDTTALEALAEKAIANVGAKDDLAKSPTPSPAKPSKRAKKKSGK